MTQLTPLNFQQITLHGPISADATTVNTVGRFYNQVAGTAAIGPQFGMLSPWSENKEYVYLDISTEPTLVEDRSSQGKENIYQYTFSVRGVPSGNTTVPPVSQAGLKKEHGLGASFILPIGAEYFEQLRALFNQNSAMRAIQMHCFDYSTDVTIGDNRAFFVVPQKYNGGSVERLYVVVLQAGTGAIPTTIEVAQNGTLKTTTDIVGGELSTESFPIFTVSTNDIISVNITAQTETPAKGLIVLIEFNG